MAQNLTTVIEHEKIVIIPVIGLEVRGRSTIAFLVAIYLPITLLLWFIFRDNLNIFLGCVFLEIMSLFSTITYLQKNTREKTDHISSGKKFYYEYKSYRKIIDDEGNIYYLSVTKPQYKLNIRRC